MTFNPFPALSGKHGAPHGRHGDAPGNFVDNPGPFFARHQGGTNGYDRGGAYWGSPSNVFAVWTADECVTYTRAKSKADAIQQVLEGKNQ